MQKDTDRKVVANSGRIGTPMAWLCLPLLTGRSSSLELYKCRLNVGIYRRVVTPLFACTARVCAYPHFTLVAHSALRLLYHNT